jgi:hypothetical protein
MLEFITTSDLNNNIRKNSFGNIFGEIEVGKILAVELSNDQPKAITHISASFRRTPDDTNALYIGAVAVFRGKVSDFPLSVDFTTFEAGRLLEHLRFFDNYGGINELVFIQAAQTDALSVVMFAPVLSEETTLQQPLFGSLSVFGSFQNEKVGFEVVG